MGKGPFSSFFEKYSYVPCVRYYYYNILLLYVNIRNSETSSDSLKVDSTSLWNKDYFTACIFSWGRNKNVSLLVAIIRWPSIGWIGPRIGVVYTEYMSTTPSLLDRRKSKKQIDDFFTLLWIYKWKEVCIVWGKNYISRSLVLYLSTRVYIFLSYRVCHVTSVHLCFNL